jgi:hypothetical protein
MTAASAERRPGENAVMPQSVCCPTCWSWSELDKRTTCKRCGAPLILSDGRTVEDVRSAPPPPPPQFAPAGAMTLASAGLGPVAYSAARVRDWVAVCRWITLGYGGLVTALLLVVGLLVRHVTVPVNDPTTGVVVYRAFDLGPAMAIAAIFVFAFFALFAWLTRYAVARAIFALLTAVAIFNTATNLGLYAHDIALELSTLLGLAVNVTYGWALLMSLLRPAPSA